MTNENRAGDAEVADLEREDADTIAPLAPHDDAHHAQGQSDASTQFGVGPFTVRELAILVAWALAFIVSFFSISTVRFDSVWTSGLLWILTIAVPTAAVFLLVLRRFSPDGIRRVGSLGIDQFASVAFSVSAVLWLQLLWETVAFAAGGGPWLRGWVVWVELALMISLVVLTVFAPFIAPLSEDFQHRNESAAHRNARPIRPVVARPRPVAPPTPQPAADASPEPGTGDDAATPHATNAAHATRDQGDPTFSAPAFAAPESESPASASPASASSAFASATSSDAAHDETATFGTLESLMQGEPERSSEATRAADTDFSAPVEPVQQAFWALAPEERDVVDDHGIPIFRMGPTAWSLVIEERDEVFVVRHEDGRIGYLHDISGVTRG